MADEDQVIDAGDGSEIDEDIDQIEEEEEDEGDNCQEKPDELEFDEEEFEDAKAPVSAVRKRQTMARLTKYELASLIGFRAQQIAEGAKPYIVATENDDPSSIAEKELLQGVLPLIIERPLPSQKIGKNTYELVSLDSLHNVYQSSATAPQSLVSAKTPLKPVSHDNMIQYDTPGNKLIETDLTKIDAKIANLAENHPIWTSSVIKPDVKYLNEFITPEMPNGLFMNHKTSKEPAGKRKSTYGPPLPKDYQSISYPALHWGQRKLLLSEIQFFVTALNDVNEAAQVVYAGAADGRHFIYLRRLFPKITFDLYDPRPFDEGLVKLSKETDSNINIYSGQKVGWFDDTVVKRYLAGGDRRKAGKLLFISDIRLQGEFTGTDKEKSDQLMIQVAQEMKMQGDWARNIQADFSVLKFKLQYPDVGKAAFEKYLGGRMYFQAWAPMPSSELRLISNKSEIQSDVWYNIPFTTAKIDYFNVFMRTSDFSQMPLTMIASKLKDEIKVESTGTLGEVWSSGKKRILPVCGADAYLETSIWVHYLFFSGIPITVANIQKYIMESSEFIDSRTTLLGLAGIFSDKLNWQSIKERIKRK